MLLCRRGTYIYTSDIALARPQIYMLKGFMSVKLIDGIVKREREGGGQVIFRRLG